MDTRPSNSPRVGSLVDAVLLGTDCEDRRNTTCILLPDFGDCDVALTAMSYEASRMDSYSFCPHFLHCLCSEFPFLWYEYTRQQQCHERLRHHGQARQAR